MDTARPAPNPLCTRHLLWRWARRVSTRASLLRPLRELWPIDFLSVCLLAPRSLIDGKSPPTSPDSSRLRLQVARAAQGQLCIDVQAFVNALHPTLRQTPPGLEAEIPLVNCARYYIVTWPVDQSVPQPFC